MKQRKTPRRGRTAYLACWAAKKRQELFDLLGRVCVLCGRTEQEADDAGFSLEFDHPHGRSYNLRALNRWQRVIQYRRDLEAKNLRVVCSECNKSQGNPRKRG